MNNLYRKFFKYLWLVPGSLLVALVVFTLVVNFFFRAEMIQYVIRQLNKQVDAKIHIQQVDFSIWKSFPYASVEFNKVLAQPSNSFLTMHPQKDLSDTLLVAGRVSFRFNLYMLLKHRYVLRKILVKNGMLNLAVDEQGRPNFDILKKGKAGEDTSSADIDLQSLVLSGMLLKYSDGRQEINIRTFCDRLSLEGVIQKGLISVNVTSEMKKAMVSVQQDTFNLYQPFGLDLKLNITDNLNYKFKDIHFNPGKLKFSGEGTYQADSPARIRFQMDARQQSLHSMIGFLPPALQDKLKSYDARGSVGLSLVVSGFTGNNHAPSATLKFNVHDGTVKLLNSSVKAENLAFDGTYRFNSDNSSKKSDLQIDKFSTKIGNGNISLTGKLTNFNDPSVSLQGLANLDIAEFKEFFALDTFERFSGQLETTFAVDGKTGRLDSFNLASASKLHYTGQLNIHDGAFKLRGSDYDLSSINGLITVNDDIYFNQLSLLLQDNDLQLTGKLTGGLAYLFRQTNEATLQAEVLSHNLDLSKYFVKGKQQNDDPYSRKILFPDHFNLDLKLDIDQFTLNKFSAKWVKGYLRYKPRMFILKSLSFESLEGSVAGNGAVLQDIDQNIVVKGQFDVNRLNIQKMFYTFNNFSQKIISDENLRGKISGNINFSSQWNQYLAFNPKMLIIEGDINIANGQLVNFEPLYGLSRFVSLDELRNVRFSTLTNKIVVKDQQVVIPEMDIRSSAFNISGSGIHQFDNHYQYKVKVLLSDVLYGKAKRAKKENEEFGVVEDDGLGHTSLYLNISGYGNDYKISYDSRKTIDVVKESFVKQKNELKEIFHQEFGWFKSDSTLNKPTGKGVKVTWDEADTSSIPARPDKPASNPVKKKPLKDDAVKVEWE